MIESLKHFAFAAREHLIGFLEPLTHSLQIINELDILNSGYEPEISSNIKSKEFIKFVHLTQF